MHRRMWRVPLIRRSVRGRDMWGAVEPGDRSIREYEPLLRVGGFVLVGVGWEAMARVLMSPVFPPLSRVAEALWGLLVSGEAWRHTTVSLQHIGVGFGLAALMGGVLGILMTQYIVVGVVVMPLVDSVRPIAALTIFPLLILVLGLGLWSKAFVIFWTAWPAILLSTVQSIRQVDPAVREAAYLDGAGRWSLLAAVVLPLASPGLVMGLRIGMGGGWISLVAAEMLGSSAGLGYLVLTSSQMFRFPTMYAAIVMIALVGLAMNSVLAVIQHVLEVRVCALS